MPKNPLRVFRGPKSAAFQTSFKVRVTRVSRAAAVSALDGAVANDPEEDVVDARDDDKGGEWDRHPWLAQFAKNGSFSLAAVSGSAPGCR